MTNKVSRVVVIGAGSIGYRHLKNLESLGVETLVICEPDPERRSQMQASHPKWKWCSELSEAFAESPEAVIIASPSAFHEDQLRAALGYRCAIFVEKPLSYRMGQLTALAKEALDRKVVTMVACNMRFHPGPVTVNQLLKSGAIGELISYRLHSGSYLPDWHPERDYRKSYSASKEAGGAVLDCIHELDLALWYAGPAKLVAAKCRSARSIGLETDGVAEILVQHDPEVVGSIHLNFIERDYRRSCVFIGTEGTLEWNFHRLEVNQYCPGQAGIITHQLPAQWQLNDMYIDEMRHFLECVAESRPTQNSIWQSLPSLKLALEIRGREV
jgi:predicted dehydrogenase